MTKTEIIELTLKQMEAERNSSPGKIADHAGIAGDDDYIIATLAELLPDGVIKTCEDFRDLGIECCDTCHTFYPDIDMRVETLPDGSRAWVCCKVSSALFDPEAKVDERPEYADMESVFAALLPNVGIVFVNAGRLWVDSTPVDDAILYDEVLTHDKGHDVFWGELQSLGAVAKDIEYDEVPRGRVWYSTRSRIYHVYLDKCILRNEEMVQQIIRTMKLPSAPLTVISTDSHHR